MRSPKKEVQKMKPKKVKGNIKASNTFGGDPIGEQEAYKTYESDSKNKNKDKSKDKDTSEKGSKKILSEAVGEAGAILGQAISDIGTNNPPPENYVSKVFARRSGFKMKYNKNNFPFKK